MIIDFTSRTASTGTRDVTEDWERAKALSSEGMFVGFGPEGEPVVTHIGDLKFTEAVFLLAWGQKHMLEALDD